MAAFRHDPERLLLMALTTTANASAVCLPRTRHASARPPRYRRVCVYESISASLLDAAFFQREWPRRSCGRGIPPARQIRCERLRESRRKREHTARPHTRTAPPRAQHFIQVDAVHEARVDRELDARRPLTAPVASATCVSPPMGYTRPGSSAWQAQLRAHFVQCALLFASLAVRGREPVNSVQDRWPRWEPDGSAAWTGPDARASGGRCTSLRAGRRRGRRQR
jgi:hypothetical protein